MALPLLAFFASEIIANITPIIPKKNYRLLMNGMNDVQTPIIPKTSPAVAKPLLFVCSDINIPPSFIFI